MESHELVQTLLANISQINNPRRVKSQFQGFSMPHLIKICDDVVLKCVDMELPISRQASETTAPFVFCMCVDMPVCLDFCVSGSGQPV